MYVIKINQQKKYYKQLRFKGFPKSIFTKYFTASRCWYLVQLICLQPKVVSCCYHIFYEQPIPFPLSSLVEKEIIRLVMYEIKTINDASFLICCFSRFLFISYVYVNAYWSRKYCRFFDQIENIQMIKTIKCVYKPKLLEINLLIY